MAAHSVGSYSDCGGMLPDNYGDAVSHGGSRFQFLMVSGKKELNLKSAGQFSFSLGAVSVPLLSSSGRPAGIGNN